MRTLKRFPWRLLLRSRSESKSARPATKRPLGCERLDSRLLMAGNLDFRDQVPSAVGAPASPVLEPLFAEVFAPLEQPAGQTYVVTTHRDTIANDGRLSLREALLAANARPGLDRIIFDRSLSGAKIALQDRLLGSLKITDDVIIQGWADRVDTYFDERVTIDGGGADGYGTRIFDIDDGRLDRAINVEISGLVLTGGWTRAREGAAVRNLENTRLKDVKLTRNRAHWEIAYGRNETERDWNAVGGAIANYHNLDLLNSQVVGNSALSRQGGGGIYNAWNLRITDSVILENQTPGEGGGIHNDRRARLELNGTVVSRNMSYGSGGGIVNQGTLVAERSTFQENATRGDLGGGALSNRGSASISHSTLTRNKVMGVGSNGVSIGGGAIYSSGALHVDSSLFEMNAVNVPSLTERNQAGGAIHIHAGTAHIENSTFRRNKARDGGAVFVTQGTLSVVNSQFLENESVRLGSTYIPLGTTVAIEGPALAARHGRITVDRDTRFSNNRLHTYGNSAIANNNYRRTQRSLEFDDRVDAPAAAPTGGAASPIGGRRRR